MCLNTDDDEQDVKNISQDDLKIYHFSKVNNDTTENVNGSSDSLPQDKCLISCNSLTTFGEDNCENYFSNSKTSNSVLNNYKKLLPMWGEINEMICVEPKVSEDRDSMELRNKGFNKPGVINMGVRNNARRKLVDNTRDVVKAQSNSYSNNDAGKESGVKSERNKLCHSRENPTYYDDTGIFSVGYSNREPENTKELKRIKEICNLDDNNQDRLVCQSSYFLNPAIEKGSRERKWRMVYADRIYKSQPLHPCPSCGRKFNDEAASRHFPICLKGKEKRELALVQKQKKHFSSKIQSNPHLTTHNVNGSIEKKEEPLKKVTKIDFIIPKALEKQIPVKDETMCSGSILSSVPIVAEPKMIVLDSYGSDNGSKDQPKQALNSKKTNNKFGMHQSESIKKSVTIWKKSVKEFIKPNKTSSSKKKRDDETNGHKDSISELESSRTWSGIKANCKFPAAFVSFNNEFRSSSFQKNDNIPETVPKTKPPKKLTAIAGPTIDRIAILNDLDIIPENIPIKKYRNNPNIKMYDSERKISICNVCGSNVKEDNLGNHLELCLRIKRLESSFIKATSSAQRTQSPVKLTDASFPTENPQYCLLRNAGDSPQAKLLKTIVCLKCPCCSTLLDLCKTN